jgi:hypothetical protein
MKQIVRQRVVLSVEFIPGRFYKVQFIPVFKLAGETGNPGTFAA